MTTMSNLRMAWLELVGCETAAHAYPSRVDELGALHVFADREIAPASRTRIVRLIAQRFPAGVEGREIGEIVLIQFPGLEQVLAIGGIYTSTLRRDDA